MHKELDKIVETDEIIRKEMDRKSRFHFLKVKNTDETRKSIERILTNKNAENLSPIQKLS